MEVIDQGVALDALIAVVKESVRQAGMSPVAQPGALRVASVELILQVMASDTAGGGVDFRVPVIGLQLAGGAKATRQDTHTIDITLVPAAVRAAARQLGSPQHVEQTLVSAIAAIRAATASAASGDDPWVLSGGVIDISFGVTKTGTISVGVDGGLDGGLTHTLRLSLASS